MTLALHALHAVASRLDPASLDDTLAIAELQTRFDRKYILTPRAFHQLTVDLHDQMEVLEIDDARCFRYESVYFDTEDLASYHDTARGRRRRFKVRTRAYLDSGQCALEVKTAGGRGETTKERVGLPLRATRSAHRRRADVHRRARSRCSATNRGSLPVLTTRYRRATLVDRRAGSRVTCDADLEWIAPDGAWVALDGYLLVETKSTGAPTVADRLLWAAGNRPVTISKFGVGMAALHPHLPANKWNRTLRRYFGWTPSPRPRPSVRNCPRTEIRGAYRFVTEQHLRLVRPHDVTGFEHVRAVGPLKCLLRVLFDEQHRGPLLVDLGDDLEDLLHDHRREAHRRLVEQEHAWSSHQRTGDREHLLLAAGHGPARLGAPLAQPREQVEHAVEVGRGTRRSCGRAACTRPCRDSRARSCRGRCRGLRAPGTGRARRAGAAAWR